jgi:hypothetical protein
MRRSKDGVDGHPQASLGPFSCRIHGRSVQTVPQQQDIDVGRDRSDLAVVARRPGTVEPVFAQMFDRFGRDVNSRGATQVETELHVCAISHNIGKIIRSRVKKHV